MSARVARSLKHMEADRANPSPQTLWWPFSCRRVLPRRAPAVPEASVHGQWLDRGAAVVAIALGPPPKVKPSLL